MQHCFGGICIGVVKGMVTHFMLVVLSWWEISGVRPAFLGMRMGEGFRVKSNRRWMENSIALSFQKLHYVLLNIEMIKFGLVAPHRMGSSNRAGVNESLLT